MIKAVKTFKVFRNEIYKWGSVLRIVNNFYFLVSLFLLVSSFIQLALQGTPFLVTLSVIMKNS